MVESLSSGHAFMECCRQGRIDVVPIILPHVDAAMNDFVALRHASHSGSLQLINYFIKLFENDYPRLVKSMEFVKALVGASERGNRDIVVALLGIPGADPSIQNGAALACAAKRGRLEIVELLLEDERVSPCAANLLSVQVSAAAGAIPVLRLLLRQPGVLEQIANETEAIMGALVFRKANAVAELLWNGSMRPGPMALRDNRVLDLVQTAERMLQRRNFELAQHVMFMSKLKYKLPLDVIDDVIVGAHGDLIRGGTVHEKIASIRAMRIRMKIL